MKFGRITRALTIALTMAILLVPARAEDEKDKGSNPSNPFADKNLLQGTWRVHVTLINCATGLPVAPPFDSLVTYADGGTAIGSTSNPAIQPRTPEHGIWRHLTGQTYQSIRDAFVLPPNAFPVGTQRLIEDIHVNGDTSTHAAAVQFLDTSGNVVRTGCSKATGHRFK